MHMTKDTIEADNNQFQHLSLKSLNKGREKIFTSGLALKLLQYFLKFTGAS